WSSDVCSSDLGNSLVLRYRSHAEGSWNVKIYYHYIRGIDYLKPATKLILRLLIADETAGNFLPLVGLSRKGEAASKLVPMQNYASGPDASGWITVSVPLPEIASGDVSALDELIFTNNPDDNSSRQHPLYIDQIEFGDDTPVAPLRDGPALTSSRGYERHVDITWKQILDPAVRYVKVYRSSDNRTFVPVGIQIPQINRYADFVDTVSRQYWYKVTFVDKDYKESD